MFTCICFLWSILLLSIFSGVGSRDEERLVRDMFRGNNKLIRPVENMTQKVEVAVIQLINVLGVILIYHQEY